MLGLAELIDMSCGLLGVCVVLVVFCTSDNGAGLGFDVVLFAFVSKYKINSN